MKSRLQNDAHDFDVRIAEQGSQPYSLEALSSLCVGKLLVVIPLLNGDIPIKLAGNFALVAEIITEQNCLIYTPGVLLRLKTMGPKVEVGGVCWLSTGKIMQISLVKDDAAEESSVSIAMQKFDGDGKTILFEKKFNADTTVSDSSYLINTSLTIAPQFINDATAEEALVDLQLLLDSSDVEGNLFLTDGQIITCTENELYSIMGRMLNGVTNQNDLLVLDGCQRLKQLCEMNERFSYSL